MKTLTIAVGDRPQLQPLRDGRVASDLIRLEFADFPVINRSFAATVERQEFDVAEIAIGAFLQARARDRPLKLLPVVEVGEFPHTGLRGLGEDRNPASLDGARLAVRSYSQTTGIWVRGMLQHQFGVDLESLSWLTQESSHVADYVDPPNVSRAKGEPSVVEMLRHGTADAGVIGPEAVGTTPLIADIREAELAWYDQFGSAAANHLVAVREDIAQDQAISAEVYRMFREAHRLVLGSPSERWLRPAVPSPVQEGVDRVRGVVELATQLSVEQAIIPAPLSMDDLFVGGVGEESAT